MATSFSGTRAIIVKKKTLLLLCCLVLLLFLRRRRTTHSSYTNYTCWSRGQHIIVSCPMVITRRFAPRAACSARYARLQRRINKMRITGPHREVHGFRYKPATCKCQELHGPLKQPGRRMYGRKRKEGGIEQRTGEPFAHHTTSNIFVGRADFDYVVR